MASGCPWSGPAWSQGGDTWTWQQCSGEGGAGDTAFGGGDAAGGRGQGTWRLLLLCNLKLARCLYRHVCELGNGGDAAKACRLGGRMV